MGVGLGAYLIGETISGSVGGATGPLLRLMSASADAGVGDLLVAVGSGVLGNIAHAGVKDAWDLTTKRIVKAGRLPLNHDLARGLRRSQLLATRFVVARSVAGAKADPAGYDISVMKRFGRAAYAWLDRELKRAERDDFLDDVSVEETALLLSKQIQGSTESGAPAVSHQLALQAQDAALDELTSALKKDGVVIPDAFLPWFEGATGFEPGWAGAARAFFGDIIKSDEKIRTAFFYDRLSAILADNAANRELLERVLQKRLDDMSSEIAVLGGLLKEIKSAVAEVRASAESSAPTLSRDMVASIVCEVLEKGEVATAMRRRAFAEALPARWISSKAAAEVRLVLDELDAPLFGREAELERLDAFVDNNSAGLIVVAGRAGSGKSALLAHWAEQRRKSGDLVVRHFINARFASTTNPTDACRHLAAQLREIDRSDEPLMGDVASLTDMLHTRMEQPAPNGERLIIVVDGLDEMREPFVPFVVDKIGVGVFVVVSGRAEPNTNPRELAAWEALAKRVPSFMRVETAPLGEGEVTRWLERTGLSHPSSYVTLARRLCASTDGRPLLVKYMIEDLTSRSDSEDARAVDGVGGLDDYLRNQLRVIEREPGGWRNLFVLLTQAMGPIAQDELRRVFASSALRGEAAPDVSLAHAPVPVARWLSVREERGADPQWAFAHPLLASAFAAVLPESEQARALTLLVEWAMGAWRAQSGVLGMTPGAVYALEYLPEHLARRSPLNCAALLSDPEFVLERLCDLGASPRRIEQQMNEWRALEAKVRATRVDGAWWDTYWTTNGPALHAAALQGAFGVTTPAALYVQSAIDAGASDAREDLPRAAAARLGEGPVVALRPTRRTSVESLGEADGVFGVPNGFVSRHRSGALAFWTDDGALRTVAARAHSAEVTGLSRVDERVLSWSRDGAIRLWDFDGSRLSGGADRAHDGGVLGVWPDPSGWLSWGSDGVVRFWGPNGEPTEHRIEAHEPGVCNLMLTQGGFATWGSDGALRFWSQSGERMDGGGAAAHRGGVNGLRCIGERLVSWGQDGAIRLWSKSGTLVGESDAHRHSVAGVQPIRSGLITFGLRGIMYLDIEGQPRDGVFDAHRSYVKGVAIADDRIASWGADEVIRFWRVRDNSLVRGARHSDLRIAGALVLRANIASWSYDGVIRLWTADGEPIRAILAPGAGAGVFAHPKIGSAVIAFDRRGTPFIYDLPPG